jgi:menaquinol-cytochrome c reductase iron-sulfur subunit
MSLNITNLRGKVLSREGFLSLFTLSFGAIAGLVVGIPIVGYVLAPLINQPPEVWRDVRLVGSNKLVTDSTIPPGQTLEVFFESNAPMTWAGSTVNQGAWLRHNQGGGYIAYAIYCTHLGCPIHWLPEAKIFLCPCHGSVFTSDGKVAGGPAPRPLFTYLVRVQNGRVQIKTHPLPVAT